MKVAFYLTEERSIRDGVTHYSAEIINRAPKDVECVGEVFLSYKDKKARIREHFLTLMPRLSLKTKRLFFPLRGIVRIFHWRLPISYECLMGRNADVRVFVLNFLPRWRVKGKNAVVIHDLTPLHDPDETSRQIKKMTERYRRTVERADFIFTDSEFSKEDILSHFPQAEGKMKVIYCGIDAERFSAPVAEETLAAVREKYGLPQSYALFMGQPRKNKNLGNLMRGFALLPQELRKRYPLVLANHTPALKELAETLGIGGEVVLLDGLADDDVPAVYHGARALALISTSEGFGLPLVEAMAAGIPIVAANATCLPEIAGEAGRFVDPYDPQSIADGLRDVLTDEQLREALIRKGQIQAKRYNWDVAAEMFYNEIAALAKKGQGDV